MGIRLYTYLIPTIRGNSLNNRDLLQREPISVCGYVGAAATCLIAGTTVADFLDKVSTDAILKYSNRNDCGPIYGQMGSLYYIYRAEGPCATTAILQTVEGALKSSILRTVICVRPNIWDWTMLETGWGIWPSVGTRQQLKSPSVTLPAPLPTVTAVEITTYLTESTKTMARGIREYIRNILYTVPFLLFLLTPFIVFNHFRFYGFLYMIVHLLSIYNMCRTMTQVYWLYHNFFQTKKTIYKIY